MTRRNLILIHRGPDYQADFDEIAQKVNALDRTITVYHLPEDLAADLPAGAWQDPTLTVALMQEFRFTVRRGPVLRHRPMVKLQQHEIFRKNGIPTPPTLPFRFGMKLDPVLFGDFVILKPGDLNLTSHGEAIHVFRRKRLEAFTERSFPASHPVRDPRQKFIVQRFVHAGPYAYNYRASTFLGEVMSLEKYVGTSETPPLTAPDAEIEAADYTAKVSRRNGLAYSAEVISFARSIAQAFPGIPLLGIDILESTAGKLYALEVNAGGNTWHYSSPMVAEYRRDNPDYFPRLKAQFGAFDVVARRLCEATRDLAS